MGSFGDYLENKVLDHIFGCTARNYTSPTNIFVALSTAAPGDDGATMAEPSGANYLRVSTAGTDWNNAGSGAVDNKNVVTFPEAGVGGWGTLTHFALFDDTQANGGNFLAWGELAIHKPCLEGDTMSFAAGALDVTLD